MKRGKYLLAITIILAVTILFVGCSKNISGDSKLTDNNTESPKNNVPENAEESNITPKGELPIVKEKVELEFLIGINGTVTDYETNEMTRKMEEMTNVHINWSMVADMGETKSLLLASGDLPEVFVGAFLSPEEQMTYGNKGVFVDMAPLIDEYGYYIHDMFEYDSNILKEITLPGGKIVSLPSYTLTYHMTAANKLWMNREWLKAIGADIPTTTEQMYDVLKAFKDQDLNNNNKQDEIPVTGIGITAWHSIIPYFMSAFIATDNTDGRYFVQPFEGKVDVVFNKKEWREGLKYINKLYSEGLIDPESITQDSALRKQKVESGLVGATIANAPSAFANADSQYFQQYDAIPPIKGPDGYQSTAYTAAPLNMIGAFTITNSCENPEVAFRWVDLLYNEELNLDNLFGNEGAEWRYAKEGELGINGKQAIWASLEGFTGASQNKSWYQTLPNFRSADWRLGEVAASKDNYYLRAGMETRLYDATTLYEPYYTTDVIPQCIYVSEDKIKEYSDIKIALYEYMYESTARFVTGDMDIYNDSIWNNYVGELDKIGLPNYIQIVQESLNID